MPIIMKSIFQPGEYQKIPDDDIGYIVSLIEDGDYMVELNQTKSISLKSLTIFVIFPSLAWNIPGTSVASSTT